MSVDTHHSDPATSWSTSLAGTALFVIWGLFLIVGEMPWEWAASLWLHYVVGILFVGTIVLAPLALCIGWINGFPRWSYPYIGNVILFSLYLTRVATPDFRVFGYAIFGEASLGWRAWIPLLVVSAIALLVTRSFRPLLRLFTNIWQDWTLLTFCMFGIMPLFIAISFDEMDRLFSLYFMVLLTLVMLGTALLYLRSSDSKARLLVLLSGVFLTVIITAVAPSFFWSNQEGNEMDFKFVFIEIIVVAAIMFSPALINLAPHSKRGMNHPG